MARHSLQGGDCAESFAEHGANNIRDFFRVFLQMAVVLTYAAASPVVKVGRIAGQFAKPRSSPTEKRGGMELPSYRGDIINDIDFTPEARVPDPRRQLEAYRQSAATFNLLRAFATGGYANLSERASMDAAASSRTARNRSATRNSPTASDRGARFHARLRHRSGSRIRRCARPISITSHEALLLGYEQAFSRVDSTTGDWYCTSRAYALDWRPHAPAGSCAYRVLPRRQKSARPEIRADAKARRAAATHRRPRSGQRARPSDA